MIDGQRLRELREARGYSREQFALKIDLGPAQLNRYERGESDATADVLARIARVLGVSADYLIGLTDNPVQNAISDLSPHEAALIAALRQGDYKEAIKIMAIEE